MEGIFRYAFEDVALYPELSSDVKDAMWIEITSEVAKNEKELEKLSEKNVMMIGRINTARKGHYNGYIATLDSTFCIKLVTHH